MTDKLQHAAAFVADFYNVSEDDARANYADEIEAALKLAKQTDCYGDGNVYRGQRSRDSQVKTVWVGLTMEDIATLRKAGAYSVSDGDFFLIDKFLREKNTRDE